jgi:hypothetical protein
LEEWLDMWITSGHYHERGVKRDQYVMARKGPDIGPYSVDNVVIQLSTINNSDGHKGRKYPTKRKTI